MESHGGKAKQTVDQHDLPEDTSVNKTLKHMIELLGARSVNWVLMACKPGAIGLGVMALKVPAAIGNIVTVAFPANGFITVKSTS